MQDKRLQELRSDGMFSMCGEASCGEHLLGEGSRMSAIESNARFSPQMTSSWHGCYNAGWQGEIMPESKLSS